MRSTYTWIILTILLTTTLNAQEEATRISDFNSGPDGTNQISSIYAIDGQLYGNFYQIYGDDAAGILSYLDDQTGAPTAILDPEKTPWSSYLDRRQPSVFSVDGIVFSITRDGSNGTNLYRLDGPVPNLLFSSSTDVFTKPVAFNGVFYFLAGTLPLREGSGAPGKVIAELWRTDGTQAATEKVAQLPATFSTRGYGKIVAGTDKL
ncbi:MAG: hypothetical protein AAF597_03630, partial [Bacteroidota bacterium]